ncbi:MAG TPA: 2,3,4,5-tetrahydropyridine-2,6-dicarboxylate N-succinyltransferase [Candidatus Eisenbacteria bacterium]|nr:2,3,4,5-tetrahydropyridine-2,6-dicarboxylate N-succinyltransferase [Candidatus Eisenbacteria bacterium]
MDSWRKQKRIVEAAWREPDQRRSKDAVHAAEEVVAALDAGTLRVAEKLENEWIVHEWLKEAILLYFVQRQVELIDHGPFQYRDKIPLKRGFERAGVRVVPPAVVRHGAYVAPDAVLMPCYINIGARVGEGTLVDTWATVGSCAQVGKGVHLSGGVGLGGVLEPIQARPVIIEDGAFIGSRCIVVEGVIVEEEAVLGAGVVLTGSTAILDVTGPLATETRGRVPARSVVIPGTRPKEFPAGTFDVPAALIIGRRRESTDRKTSLNDALREFGVPV